jgi:hypothetical protein
MTQTASTPGIEPRFSPGQIVSTPGRRGPRARICPTVIFANFSPRFT